MVTAPVLFGKLVRDADRHRVSIGVRPGRGVTRSSSIASSISLMRDGSSASASASCPTHPLRAIRVGQVPPSRRRFAGLSGQSRHSAKRWRILPSIACCIERNLTTNDWTFQFSGNPVSVRVKPRTRRQYQRRPAGSRAQVARLTRLLSYQVAPQLAFTANCRPYFRRMQARSRRCT